MPLDHNKRIVVGVDGSHLSGTAVRWAARTAGLRGFDLHLVHAMAGDMPLLGFGERDDAGLIRGQGVALLESARAQAHAVDPDITITTSCQKGFASKALLRASTGTAGIVVGAHGHGTLSRASAGAVAVQVATHAKCPVAVVPRETPPTDDHGVVLVGIDGSAAAGRALTRGFEHARVRGSRLHVIHAWNARGADANSKAPAAWDDYTAEVEDRVASTLATARRENPAVTVDTEVVQGDPRRVLEDHSTRSDLAVIGARGDGGFPGLHMGRVALHLMAHSACPVVLSR